MPDEQVNVASIVRAWLKEHGYDGLYSPSEECGCGVDDLFPCGYCQEGECMPAYRYPDPEGELDLVYGPEKPKETP